ncbi:YggT family protein [Roseomonas sp. AR75]|uniref:YggT family protein n=1 Tax=Roseomonas sp. AR75 TaxID=2562311 RepID=UPI0010C09FC1|nr:YggT family protein [Roseomonas sp. AR75]
MQGSDFILGHLPFWVVIYGLAAIGWTLIGRFMLQFLVPQDSALYIWRAFRRLTDWAVAIAARMVPSFVAPGFLPLVAAFWVFTLRMVLGIGLWAAGWAPRFAPPAG